MNEEQAAHREEARRNWGRDLDVVACTRCRTAFHVPTGDELVWCCWCAAESLEPAEERLCAEAPERRVPFAIDRENASQRLRAVCRGFFKPKDLRPARLAERLQKLWVPSWLVDSRMKGSWRAELGFNYQVVSHEEHYRSGDWESKEVRETRVDWEPRLGTMDRVFENAAVPAWSQRHRLGDLLETLDGEGGEPADGAVLDEAPVLVPDLAPDEVWPDAHQSLLGVLSGVLTEACGAQHLQRLVVQDEHSEQCWTLQLHPIWTTWYCAEDGRVVPLYLDGRAGTLHGELLGAPRRARRWALGFAAAAAVTLGLGMVYGELAMGLGLMLGCASALCLLSGLESKGSSNLRAASRLFAVSRRARRPPRAR
ncbi:MAG: hypothetical protein AAF533_03410 [Acidobacteriota bacterium]